MMQAILWFRRRRQQRLKGQLQEHARSIAKTPVRLRLECLEDRRVLSTFSVFAPWVWLSVGLFLVSWGCTGKPATEPEAAPTPSQPLAEQDAAERKPAEQEPAQRKPAEPAEVGKAGPSQAPGPREPEASKPAVAASPSPPPAPRPVEQPVRPAPRPLNEMVAGIADGMVYITCQDALREDVASGSGFLIDKSGLVATNYHVLTEAASAVVQFRDGNKCPVVGVRAMDPERDLAILEIKDCPPNRTVLALGEPPELKQGMELAAFGHPSGFRFTVTSGILSAVRRTDELPKEYQQALSATAADTVWVQSSAAISSGSSGGALVDRSGNLVGINTWIAEGQNLGFAIHVRHLKELLARVESEPRPLPLLGYGVLTDAKVAAICKEYLREYEQVMREEMQNARSPEDAAAIVVAKAPAPRYAGKLLELADAQPKQAAALEALMYLCQIGARRPRTRASVVEAARRLERDHLRERQMADVALALANTPWKDTMRLLRRLAEESPHREARAAATIALANALSRVPDGEEKYQPEIIELLERVTGEFGNVWVAGMRPAKDKETQSRLFTVKSLRRGRVAPNVVGTDCANAKFELKDYRGKVTMVDFWVDWCPYCRELYPLERQLVEQFRDAPFALVGINGDERPTLERLVSEKTITWRNWHDGPEGPIQKQWQVSGYPSIYLLDANGVIRDTGPLRGEFLVAAVEYLLGEMALKLPRDVLATGATWKYCEQCPDSTDAWPSAAYDDAKWPSGRAPFGYGWGDEVTKLPRGKSPTVYFRTEVIVPDPSQVKDLAMELFRDDGAAVYVNGVEVARTNLPPASKHGDFAQPCLNHGRQRDVFSIDPKRLTKGRNVIAAEVHQDAATGTDLRFDLALSSNVLPMLQRALRDKKSPARRVAASLLGELGPAAGAAVGDLRAALEGADCDFQARLALALVRIDPAQASKIRLRPPEVEIALEYRAHLSLETRDRAWDVLRAPGYSPHDYEKAVAEATLASMVIPDPQLHELKALGELRRGRYEASIKAIRSSALIKFKYSPVELACMCMAQHRLGQNDQARKTLASLGEMLKKSEWLNSADVQELFEEAQAAVVSIP